MHSGTWLWQVFYIRNYLKRCKLKWTTVFGSRSLVWALRLFWYPCVIKFVSGKHVEKLYPVLFQPGVLPRLGQIRASLQVQQQLVSAFSRPKNRIRTTVTTTALIKKNTFGLLLQIICRTILLWFCEPALALLTTSHSQFLPLNGQNTPRCRCKRGITFSCLKHAGCWHRWMHWCTSFGTNAFAHGSSRAIVHTPTRRMD